MNAKQKLHQAHLAEWSARFTDQKASGLTIRQWCDKHSLSIHKFNNWYHLLKEVVVDQMLPDIVPIPLSALSPADPPQPDIVQPDTAMENRTNRANRANRAIRANYTNPNVRLCVDGVALELESSVSEEFLRTLIRAVHYA